MLGNDKSAQDRLNNGFLLTNVERDSETKKDSLTLDPFLFSRLLADAGYSLKSFATETKIAHNTLLRIPACQGIHPSTAKKIADCLNTKVTRLLDASDSRYRPAEYPETQSEWSHDEYLGGGTLASNGLYFIPCRLKHHIVTGSGARFGRGKYYHLSLVKVKSRDELLDKLSRQADVCARVGHHINIPSNLSCGPTPSGEGWWVIDDWVGHDTLEDLVLEKRISDETVPSVLLQIAEGLRSLHDAEVVMRELAPCRVLLNDKQSRVVLTDFELAKLLQNANSVSGAWKDDPFRAPEISGTDAKESADLYSFARVAAFVLNGKAFVELSKNDCFSRIPMPAKVRSCLLKCLESNQQHRPQSVDSIIDDFRKWAEKVRAA